MAARRASTPQDKVQWLILHDAWREFADLRERGKPMLDDTPAAGLVKANAGRGKAVVGSGNRLRARLRLVTNSDVK